MAIKLIRHTVVEPGRLPPRLLPSKESNVSYEYMFGAGGVYFRATLPDFELLLPWIPGRINGLAPLTPYLRLNFPRVPATLLELVFDKAQRTKGEDGRIIETLFYFRFDRETEDWHAAFPPQQGGRARVVPTATGAGSAHETAAVELHSHHDLSLGARFSGQDDLDERTRARLFCVIGHISSPEPEIRIRAGVFGHYFELPASQLFDLPQGIHDSRDKDIEHEARAAAFLFANPVDPILLRSHLVRGLASFHPDEAAARALLGIGNSGGEDEDEETDEAEARAGVGA